MKALTAIFGILISVSVLAPSADAALVITVQPSSSFTTNTGIRNINVFVRSTTAMDSGLVLTADFSLTSGVSFSNPNAGTFGGLGFVGNGNINAAGSSFLRDPGNPSLSYLSIEFNAAQSFTNTDGLLAAVAINTNGLAVGIYTINFVAADLDGSAASGTGGTITIVPEPSSFALFAAFGIVGLFVRKRR